MTWTMLDTWIVLAGGLSAMSCALLGCFLVLRRMSMMGDAISHAVLPGLAIAFFITQSRASLPMFIGAAIVGVLTAVLTQVIHRMGKVEESASMGVVFTTLFAIGLILIVRAADKVDLDPGCVLYGAAETAVVRQRGFLGVQIPNAVITLGLVFLINLGFVIALYKEFKISTFDPALATTLGINAQAMQYLLMTLVAVTTVASFESVGSILVIAMLIVPAAAAHLLTDRLALMLVVSVLIGAGSALLGHTGAIAVPGWFGFSDTISSGMMAVAAGAIFAVAMLAAPRHGIVSKLLARWRLTLQIAREDALGLLYRLEELGAAASGAGGRGALTERLHEALGLNRITARAAVLGLARRGYLRHAPAGHELTDAGRAAARSVVRSHRLWESYLVRQLGLRPDHVHDTAMRLEHITDPSLQQRLAERVEHVQIDPHGRTIPDAPGKQTIDEQ